MTNKTSPYTLLETIVEDNDVINFPVEAIRTELNYLLFSSDEFEYFIKQSYLKIKSKYGAVFAHIYIQLMDISFSSIDKKIYEMTTYEYVDMVCAFIELLEQTKITRIQKNSPDYQIITEINNYL